MKSHVTTTNQSTIKLTVCAIMVAMSTVLSFIKFTQLPYGGSVTLFSFVPILLVGYAYGRKWGLGSGVVYGILQAILGVSNAISGAGFKWWQVLLCVFLDYIVAGSMLGTAGMFKKVFKKPQLSFALGSIVACLLRLFWHFWSGFILFGSYAEWYFTEGGGVSYGSKILGSFTGNELAAIYSLVYNASFIVPEIILSVIMAVILISVKPIKKLCDVK